MNLLINRSRAFFFSIRVLRTLFTPTHGCNTCFMQSAPINNCFKTESTPEETIENRLKIITTIFPHYDFVRAVVGSMQTSLCSSLPELKPTHTTQLPQILLLSTKVICLYIPELIWKHGPSILQGVSNENLRVVALAEDIDQHHDDAHHDHEDDSYEYSDATHIHIHELDPTYGRALSSPLPWWIEYFQQSVNLILRMSNYLYQQRGRLQGRAQTA